MVNAFVMYVVHITAFLYAMLAVTNLLTTYAGMTVSLMVQSTLAPLYAGIMLTLPDVLLCVVEEGGRAGFKFFVGIVDERRGELTLLSKLLAWVLRHPWAM